MPYAGQMEQLGRRALLRGGAALAAGALAGCGGLGERLGDAAARGPEGPADAWGGETLTVAVETPAPTRLDFRAVVREGLDFWTDNAAAYAGYDVAFEIGGPDPDLRVRLVAAIPSCGAHDGRVDGCATVTTGRRRTARIRVLNGYDREHTLGVVTHELGHALGLDHDDDPQSVMSDDPAVRAPDREEKQALLERHDEAVGRINDGTAAINTAIDRLRADEFTRAETAAGDARRALDDAVGLFGEARAIAAEIDNAEAAAICGTHREAAVAYREAAAALVSMARADDADAYERHRRTYGDRIETAREIGIDPAALRAVVDLDVRDPPTATPPG